MTTSWKINISFGAAALVVIVFAAVSFMNQSVHAIPDNVACPNSTTQDYTNDCIDRVYQNIPPHLRQGITQDQMVDMARACRNHDSNGLGKHEGGCVNAAATCIERLYNVADCTNKPQILTEMVDDCNDGKGMSNAPCQIIINENNNALREVHDRTVAEARETCVVPADGTGANGARNECEQAVCSYTFDANGCDDYGPCKRPYEPTRVSNRYRNEVAEDIKEYEDCMDAALVTASKNPEECQRRGGIYMHEETAGPNGENVVPAGCKYQATDLINEEACKAAGKGFIWKQEKGANTPNNKSDDVWRCEDPNNPDGKDDDNDKETLAGVVDGNLGDKVTGQCGEEARTNLIRCETEGGAAAFNNVLRIFVIVLSFGIGIAAIGGLAFSAIQYAQASDNEGSVSAARERIRNIVIGLFLYGFLLAIVNWLIPGGMFG